jgi:signal transduction histidine kinase
MAIDPATPLPAGAEPRARVRAPTPAAILLAVGAALIAVYFALAPTGQALLYPTIGLASAAAIVVGTLVYVAEDRLAWWLFAAGIACEALGDAAFNYYDLVTDSPPPIPSVADALYLAGYPLLFAGIVVLIWRRDGGRSAEALIDVAIVTVAFALAQWVFLIDPLRHQDLSAGEEAIGMAYPAVDVLLLAGFAQLALRSAWRTWSYQALFASVLLLLVADEIYLASLDSYASGDWIDALWLASYVLFAAAALDPAASGRRLPDRRVTSRLTPARLVLLAAALLTAPVVLVIEHALGHDVHGYEIAIAGAVLAGLVLARVEGLVHGLDAARAAERRARHDAEQAQRELAARNERLEELDRLKDEFVSLVSHDLRTPLTSISGYVELMLEGPALDEETAAHLRVVDRNTERLLHLVNDLLFVAQMQAGAITLERQDVDLAATVADCVEALRPRADAAGVTLTAVLDGPVSVRADRRRVAQVLDNLVANAIKFTPAGGAVAVRAAREPRVAVFEVSDTGIGMSEEDRGRLFERFFRAESAVARQIPGTGLGLHIAETIVDAHGGLISARERPGGGTIFRVELPA